MIRYGEPEPEPKGVKMIEAVSGKPVIVQEFQFEQHIKQVLLPLFTEAGVNVETLNNDHPLKELLEFTITLFQDMRCRLEMARKEFDKLQKKQHEDHQTMLKFMSMFVKQHAKPAESGNVIPLRKAA